MLISHESCGTNWRLRQGSQRLPQVLWGPAPALLQAPEEEGLSLDPQPCHRDQHPGVIEANHPGSMAGRGQAVAGQKRIDQNPVGWKCVTQFFGRIVSELVMSHKFLEADFFYRYA